VLTDTVDVCEQSVRLRVLLVEDDPAFVEFLSTSLDPVATGLELTVAPRLRKAVSALASAPFDAILLDLNLPDSEGLLTLRQIASVAPHMPIVVFTGIDDARQAEEALRLGAEDWLTKGAPDAELVVRAVRYAVERKRLANRLVRLQKLDAVGRLAGSVAHEFNNVLTTIIGNAAFAESATDGEARANALREIQHAATRGALLTRQLLGVSRPQISSPPDADVQTVVATVESLFQAVLPRRIELRVAPMARLRVALASEQLEQILLNLILNARDAMTDPGTISITARRSGIGLHERQGSLERRSPRDPSWVRIEIHDTGRGIPTEMLARIFEPFFTTKGASGSGLGLAISKELIEHVGGQIYAESSPGEGATFIVDLPEVTGDDGDD
jgi:two-component system cell cycle sensor histidine kinase/response regulator CckA